MRKSGLFQKLMLYLVGACFLTAALSAVLYFYFGIRSFGNQITAEMFPRARSVARLSARYMEGKVGFDAFSDFVLNDQQRGSHVYIYDDQGNLFAYSANTDDPSAGPPEIYATYVNQVLTDGQTVTETNWRKIDGVLVAVPVIDNLKRVCGVVLLTKPAGQLRTAMVSMTTTLVFSSVIASVWLTALAYFGSRRFVGPIRQMTDIAKAMAAGDFSARADETTGGEVGQLGQALNFLSGELSTTIGDLVLARNRLTTILTGLSEGIVAMDHSFSRITFMNPAAQALLHYDGQTLLPDDADAERFMQLSAQVTNSDTPAQMHLALGGRQLLLTLTRSQAAVDLQPGVIVLVQDVTEAERLEQTRRDYVANVSHELRTPIASIRSLAETLNDGLIKSDSDRSRYYGYILRESLRLSRLIDDLLELSRLQSGTVALTKQAFSLDELLAAVAEHMRINAAYSDIVLAYQHEPLPPAYSNPDRIEQVLVALTDNAIKYASDGGLVTLLAREDGDRFRVEVRNTGHIADEDLPHLFERFYKADKSHAGQGTGLGLAIAREVLLQLGEDVGVRNEGEEVVFTFTVAKEKQ